MLYTGEKNETLCVNALGAQDSKTSEEQLNDFTLGDSFLRNVYILYNYGNWTANTTAAAPYVQLLPVSTIKQVKALTSDINVSSLIDDHPGERLERLRRTQPGAY